MPIYPHVQPGGSASAKCSAEVIRKAFGALDGHDPERKPSAWILRIANNTAIDYVRRKRPDSTRSHLTMTPGQIDVRARRIPAPRVTP